jgi:hypothetical protein
MSTTAWNSVASSKNFTYKAEAKRPWSSKTILELLEETRQEFEKLMGQDIGIVIQVEDRICEPNNWGARAEIKRQIYSLREPIREIKIICELPMDFGYTEPEQDLAYHFFVHELFHCWIGGTVSNDYEPIIEAITQYMTGWVLVHLGWCSEELLVRERADWQEMAETEEPPYTTIAIYKLLFDEMYTDDPENLFAFCRDLAYCFHEQRNREETDILPVLQHYFGAELEED